MGDAVEYDAFTAFLYRIDDFMWGTWMTFLLVGIGIILSIRFAFRYQRKIIFNFKNTYGRIGAKGEGEGTISGFRAACTALANTVGTGNISGVATAIVSGGPGALVWMWVSAFFGMSTKACEIIIGQRYREHYKKSMNEYVCDRSFVLKNAFGWKKGAVLLAVFCFVFGPWTCCVQTEAVTSSMNQAFGISPLISVIIIGITCMVTIWGGLRRISDVMSRAVPIMAVLYILMGLGVLILNFQHIPAVQTDHPVRQSLWGWGEVFIDTFIICSITAFTIIMTGSYTTSNATSGALTTIAFTNAYGAVGGKLTAIAIAVFAWTTIIGMYYTCEKSVNYAFGDTENNKKMMPVYMIYYMLPCVIFYNIKAEALWAFTDILSALYVCITVFIIVAKRQEIFRLFDDFWQRYLPEKEAGKNPPYVTFDCREDN